MALPFTKAAKFVGDMDNLTQILLILNLFIYRYLLVLNILLSKA